MPFSGHRLIQVTYLQRQLRGKQTGLYPVLLGPLIRQPPLQESVVPTCADVVLLSQPVERCD
jgi:hypothetical protein